jgi:hypothetical protein
MSELHVGYLVRLKDEKKCGVIYTIRESKFHKCILYIVAWDNHSKWTNHKEDELIFVSSGFTLFVSRDFFDFREKVEDRMGLYDNKI